MSDSDRVNNLERYVWENKLLTMKGGEFFGTNVKNIFLFGLITSSKIVRVESVEGIRGQLLIISSNPMYLDGKNWRHQFNMINMDKLPLTKAQRAALLRGSIYGGGRVSVYVGKFILEKCTSPGNCQLLNSSSLNVLRLLCGNNIAYRTEMNMEKAIPITDKQLNETIMVKMEEAFGQHDDIGSEATSSCCSSRTGSDAESAEISDKKHGSLVGEMKGGESENFRFWKMDSNQLLVEMICPKKHWGYKVDVEFLETLVSEPNAEDPFHGPQISRILVRDEVNIKATLTAGLVAEREKIYRNDEIGESSELCQQLISEALMLLPIPDYSNARDQGTLDAWKVNEIMHICKLRLIRNTNPNKIGPKTLSTETTANVGRKKVLRRSNTFPPAAVTPKIYTARQAAPDPEATLTSPLYVINAQCVGTAAAAEALTHSYLQCRFPVKLTLMKAVFSDEWKCRCGAHYDMENDWNRNGRGDGEGDAFSGFGKHADRAKCFGGCKSTRQDCFNFWRFPRGNK